MLEDVSIIDMEENSQVIYCPLNKHRLYTDWCVGCTINDEIHYDTVTRRYVCKVVIE